MSNLVITGSADKTIKIFDMSSGFNELGSLKSTDSVFCGELLGSFIAVGCGDGSVLGYDLNTQDCLYGYGADEKGAVRNLKIVEDKGRIITGGDSGRGLELCY